MSSIVSPRASGIADVDRDPLGLLPSVSASLWLWDQLGLELGEGAVVTGGHPWSRVAALVATWYGALPVWLLDAGSGRGPELPGVDLLPWAGRGPGAFGKATRSVVAAELSGRADAVDFLLESLPAGSRVFFGGSARERLTIDYYVNVHRKGLRLTSGVFGEEGDRRQRTDALLDRARRLLEPPERAVACGAALAGGDAV